MAMLLLLVRSQFSLCMSCTYVFDFAYTFISLFHRFGGHFSFSSRNAHNLVWRSIRMGTCAKAKISTSTGNNTQNIIPSIWHSSYSAGERVCVCVRWTNKRWMPCIVATSSQSFWPAIAMLCHCCCYCCYRCRCLLRKWTIAYRKIESTSIGRRAVKHIFYSYMERQLYTVDSLVCSLSVAYFMKCRYIHRWPSVTTASSSPPPSHTLSLSCSTSSSASPNSVYSIEQNVSRMLCMYLIHIAHIARSIRI